MAVRNLSVELCGASGLKNSEFIGKSDPYVILSIGKTERTSKVAKNQATDPTWNEKFSLPVLDTDTELVIRILNHNTLGKDDEMGRVLIPLSEIHASTYALRYKGKPQGEIKLNLSFVSEGDHESKGLVKKIDDLCVGEKKEEKHQEEKIEAVSEEKKKDDEKTAEKKKKKKKKAKTHWFVHTPKSHGDEDEEEERREEGEENRREEEGGEQGGESSSSSSSESEQEEENNGNESEGGDDGGEEN